MFKVIETFSGIGSQAKALERIGTPFEIVHTAEWDIYSTMAYCLIHKGKIDVAKYEEVSDADINEYLMNKTLSSDGKSPITKRFFDALSNHGKRIIYSAFQETKNLGSVTDISWKDIPEDIDLLTYSFPCQDLSLCSFWHGNFSGIDRDSGNRSSLLWEIERILFEIKRENRQLPKFLLMENVKAILGSRHKNNFEEWKNHLNELGYVNYVYCLNASNFGVPQKRERAYMISVLCEDDEERRQKVIQYVYDNNLVEHRSEGLRLPDILKIDYSNDKYKKEAEENTPNDTPSRRQIYNENDHLVDNNQIEADFVVKTLTTKQDRNPNSGVIDFPNNLKGKSKFRYLTPRECFLLMGFDEKDFDAVIDNNFQLNEDSKAVAFNNERLIKMAGNSIVVNVLEAIFKQIQEIDELCFRKK